MRPAGSVEARTWGLITQPHTVMRPARHRRPSLIPGAHQVSRKGDGQIMGGVLPDVDELVGRFFAKVSGINALAEWWGCVDP